MRPAHPLYRRYRALMGSLAVLLVAGGALAPGAAQQPTALTVYAEAFVPLQHPSEQNNEPTGYVVQFVQELLARVQQRVPLQVRPLEFVPLKRALIAADRDPNVLVLSVARTPEREAKYTWLTEVSPYQLWLYRAKGHALPPIKTIADLKGQGLRFGVQNGANFHEWLRAQGIGLSPDNSVIDPTPQNNLNFRKALAGRIDLFAHPEISFAYRVQQAGMAVTDFEPVLHIQPLSVPLWLAISKQSDPALVDELRASIKALKATGRFPFLNSQTPK